jgi:Flp pilus assembly protein CpaB
MSRVALIVAIAALALAGYAAVVSRSSDEQQHRCGGTGNGRVLCVSNDTPRHIEGRSCFPFRRIEGVMHWACNRKR